MYILSFLSTCTIMEVQDAVIQFCPLIVNFNKYFLNEVDPNNDSNSSSRPSHSWVLIWASVQTFLLSDAIENIFMVLITT